MLRSTALATLLMTAALPVWAQDAAPSPDAASPDAATSEAAAPAEGQTAGETEGEAPAEAAPAAPEPQAGTQAAPAPAPEPVEADLGQVLATVNGTDITLGHVIVARRTLPQQFQGLPDEALLPGLVDQLVQQTLLSGALEEVPPAVSLQLENEERNLRAAATLNERLQEAITEEDLRAAYEERVAGEEPQTEWRASHILVETEEAAREAITEIEGGADFADVARARSTDPAGPQGGDLGFFREGMMVEPFEAAVRELEPGEVSEPVQTQFGWHVIRLEEEREAEAPAFEALAPEIAQELQREAVEGYLAELTEEADITREPLEGIDPSVLSRAELE